MHAVGGAVLLDEPEPVGLGLESGRESLGVVRVMLLLLVMLLLVLLLLMLLLLVLLLVLLM